MSFMWFLFSCYVLLIGVYSLIVGLKVCRHKTIVRNEETLHCFLKFLIFSIPFGIISCNGENLSFTLKFIGVVSFFAIFALFWFLFDRKFYGKQGFQILKYVVIFNVSIDDFNNVITGVTNLFNDKIEVTKLRYFSKLFLLLFP